MRRSLLLALVFPTLLLAVRGSAADDVRLTIGNPAPPIEAEFIQGESVGKIREGTVYVVEFTGTQCRPCLLSIPHMEALQARHAEAVFVNVFGDSADEVREYLKGPGKELTQRVARSEEGMWDTWMKPACRQGIPCVFVVDAKGAIAWIGSPEDVAEPLAQIIAGTYSDPLYATRIRLEQAAVSQARKKEEREDEAYKTNEVTISVLIKERRIPEALDALEAARVKYADIPYWAHLFRARKLCIYALAPERNDEAYELAMEVAGDAYGSKKPEDRLVAGYDLGRHCITCPEGKCDLRILQTALILFDEEVPADDATLESRKSSHLIWLARLYDLKGDIVRAVRIQEIAIRRSDVEAQADLELRKAKFPDEVEEAVRYQEEHRQELQADLKRYQSKIRR